MSDEKKTVLLKIFGENLIFFGKKFEKLNFDLP